MNLTADELAFLKEYRRLEDLERQKGIKFFECCGDPPATDEFVEGVSSKRQNFITDNLDKMRDQDCHRFETEINRDKVIVPVEVNLCLEPKWDVYENNHFAMRKRLVDIFLKNANKVMVRIRAGKRLRQLKAKLAEEHIESR